MGLEPLPDHVEHASQSVADAAFKVHKTLGPGLFQSQLSLPIVYDRIRIDAGLRVDLLVAASVIVELKAVEKIHPLCVAQVLTYLKLTGLRLGLAINFNVPLIRDGIKRIIL